MASTEDKAELRAFVRLTRAARSTEEIAVAEQHFAEFLAFLAEQYSWIRIAAFIPTDTEPPIARGVDDVVGSGVSVIVPVSSNGGLLEWIELSHGSVWSTVEDSQRMPIPSAGERVDPGVLDAVLVPAAAVDRDGNRLGWGKGYYDRFLADVAGSPLIIAVVFAADVIDTVPVEPHDAPVGAVLTETEIFFTQ